VAQERSSPPDDLVIGNLRLSPATFGLSVQGRAIDLTYFEFELLRLLCNESDRIVPYDALCQALWQSTGQRERRRLNVAICRVRSKLAGSSPYKLETVRGRGYGLIAQKPARRVRLKTVPAAE
jgi:DNA-binding response OmpR family regulator